jgi:hypothetical protein
VGTIRAFSDEDAGIAGGLNAQSVVTSLTIFARDLNATGLGAGIGGGFAASVLNMII